MYLCMFVVLCGHGITGRVLFRYMRHGFICVCCVLEAERGKSLLITALWAGRGMHTSTILDNSNRTA